MASNASAGDTQPKVVFSLVPKPKSVPPRYCAEKGCKARLARVALDPHVLCVQHRGVDCNLSDRCDVCSGWDNASMSDYLSHQQRLASKRKASEKNQRPGGSQGGSSLSDPQVMEGPQEVVPEVVSEDELELSARDCRLKKAIEKDMKSFLLQQQDHLVSSVVGQMKSFLGKPLNVDVVDPVDPVDPNSANPVPPPPLRPLFLVLLGCPTQGMWEPRLCLI